jgi:hypothetical protein
MAGWFDWDHRRADLTRDLGRPMPRHTRAQEEGGTLRWALNTECLTLLPGAVVDGARCRSAVQVGGYRRAVVLDGRRTAAFGSMHEPRSKPRP